MRFRFPAVTSELNKLGIYVTDITEWSLVHSSSELGFRACPVDCDRFIGPVTIFFNLSGKVEGSPDTFGYIEYEPMGSINLPTNVLDIS